MKDTEKPKLTMQDLEQAIESYKGFAAKTQELPQYVQMALLPMFIETLPEGMQKYAHQMLGVKYAQEAHQAGVDERYGDAAGYVQLAEHYMRMGGIDTKTGEQNLGSYMQSIKEYFKELK